MKEKTLWKWANGINIYDSENKCTPGAGLSPPRGHMHVYYHNIQRSSLIPLGQSKPNFVWSILWEGGTKVIMNGQGHMTKMAAMAINSKNL